MAAETN